MAVDTATSFVARLGPDGGQQVFRLLLDAFSRPGTVIDLGPIADAFGVEPALVPVLALADLEVVTAVLDHPDADGETARLLERSTDTRVVDDLPTADMVLALRPPTAAEIGLVRRGDAVNPELGARLVLRVDHIAADAPGAEPTAVRLSGPGARDGRTVTIAPLDPAIIAALQHANAEQPAGVDTWLVDRRGRCVGIPRSQQLEIIEGAN